MNHFSFEDLERTDFFAALSLWIVIELVNFAILPGLQFIQPGNRLPIWFGLSLPLGLGGAFLIGTSSRFVALAVNRRRSNTKTLMGIVGQLGGWVGLAGILFPLVVTLTEFFSKLSFPGQK